jgi:hypothetical protein
MWRDMALFNNKQFTTVLVLGGLGAYWFYRKSVQLVGATGDAVSDSVWWYGHQIDLAGDSLELVTMDAFDQKHRLVNNLITDAQYLRWKNAVLTGQIPEPDY